MGMQSRTQANSMQKTTHFFACSKGAQIQFADIFCTMLLAHCSCTPIYHLKDPKLQNTSALTWFFYIEYHWCAKPPLTFTIRAVGRLSWVQHSSNSWLRHCMVFLYRWILYAWIFSVPNCLPMKISVQVLHGFSIISTKSNLPLFSIHSYLDYNHCLLFLWFAGLLVAPYFHSGSRTSTGRSKDKDCSAVRRSHSLQLSLKLLVIMSKLNTTLPWNLMWKARGRLWRWWQWLYTFLWFKLDVKLHSLSKPPAFGVVTLPGFVLVKLPTSKDQDKHDESCRDVGKRGLVHYLPNEDEGERKNLSHFCAQVLKVGCE